MTTTLNPELIEAAREWLKDIVFEDIEPEDLDNITDAEIERAVERHYEGGIIAFLHTNSPTESGV